MKDILKFITCGSVDDGKSTLIGHMLYDAKLLFADQKRALELDSRIGSADGKVDYSLLLDGLMAEREQGITIDVAYRFFSTKKRSFIVADTPGHEEYTRNMAVGASFGELAVILIDAQRGVMTQTKRHTRICALMGIRDFVFAVNKMDLVNYDRTVYDKIKSDMMKLMEEFSVHSLSFIPVSASEGDNLVKQSERMRWYKRQALLPYLEEIEVWKPSKEEGFCMPVQYVCRPNRMFRGFQGEICCGTVKKGETVSVLPSGEKAVVSRMLVAEKEKAEACLGQPITICLEREIDAARGCVLAKGNACHVGDEFAAALLWTEEKPLVEGKRYLLKLGTQKIPAIVKKIRFRMDVDTNKQTQSICINKNEIAVCELKTDETIVFTEFAKIKNMGGFILIDRVSHATAACGTVMYPLHTEGKASGQELTVTRKQREERNGHPAFTVWFTGLSGSGKSTLADYLEKKLFASGYHTMLLDGDNVRLGLNQNLGFSKEDRRENIRRVAEAAKLLNDAGVVVLAAFVSPYQQDRQMAREIIGDDYIEVFVNTRLEVCEKRDVKGLYAKARRGEIREFTGISDVYEKPDSPEITVDTSGGDIEELTEIVLEGIKKRFERKTNGEG